MTSLFFRCADCDSDLFMLTPSYKAFMAVCRGCVNSYEIFPDGTMLLVRRGVAKLKKPHVRHEPATEPLETPEPQ
jgi:hypothetical protein